VRGVVSEGTKKKISMPLKLWMKNWVRSRGTGAFTVQSKLL